MIDKGYGLRWNSRYRSDHGDARTIEMMRRAGCEGVFLDIEAGSDQQLQRMNKTARRADHLAAPGEFRRAEISTYASLVIGFPGETAETVAATESLLAEGRPDFSAPSCGMAIRRRRSGRAAPNPASSGAASPGHTAPCKRPRPAPTSSGSS